MRKLVFLGLLYFNLSFFGVWWYGCVFAELYDVKQARRRVDLHYYLDCFILAGL